MPRSRSPHCPDERVDGGRLTGLGDHGASDPLSPLDLKAGEVLDDLLRPEQDCRVLWPTGSLQAGLRRDFRVIPGRWQRGEKVFPLRVK